MNERAIRMLNETFTKYSAKKIKANTMLQYIGTTLSAITFEGNRKKTFEVHIVDNNTNVFFGMRVYPSIDKIDAITKYIVEEDLSSSLRLKSLINEWRNLDKWVVELDSRLFEERTNGIFFTAHEMTAMLLHEIGHVIYSDEPVEIFYNAFKEATKRIKTEQKYTQKLMYIIYTIPLSSACMYRSWAKPSSQLQIEMVADKTVIKLGYGPHLLSALEKIVKAYGDAPFTETNEKEVNALLDWSVNNILDTVTRINTIKNDLYYQTLKTPSIYNKAIRIAVLDKLGFSLREKYSGIAMENNLFVLSDMEEFTKYVPELPLSKLVALESQLRIASQMKPAMEARDKKGVIELPSQYEIDTLHIDVDKITNHYDRVYVLDLAYELLDRIATYENAIVDNKRLVNKYTPIIKNMRKEIEIIRRTVLNKKIPKTSHKLYIEVPEGYEG